ncbi:MAG: phosphoribosylformylglycinamidine synthase subunit PurQ [Acidimicrobiia bacterium]|nr:phosphoribosylformylglycinamidine synthase subunit PurQ [Acidimicrobiia bacterium]
MIGVIVFPGTNCERDTVRALRMIGAKAELVWHGEEALDDLDGVVLPGGFAHGDYLRTGAIAAHSPVMKGVRRMADAGRPVLGICNGFQVLCEAGLLPGAFVANRNLRFICRFVEVEISDSRSALTEGLHPGTRIRIPLNSFEGNHRDPTGTARVVARYVDDPNGSQDGVAALANTEGNVVGIMPHPERAMEEVMGSGDGSELLESFVRATEAARV